MIEKRRAKYPYNGYYTTGPVFNPQNGRYIFRLIPISGEGREKASIVAVARYFYCVHNKIKLASSVHIDHKDGDCTHDVIDNLQTLDPKANNHKRLYENQVTKSKVELKCPECDSIFYREKRQTFLSKKGVFTACSRSCSGKFRRRLQVAKDECKGMETLKEKIASNFVAFHKGNNTESRSIIDKKHIMDDWFEYTEEY